MGNNWDVDNTGNLTKLRAVTYSWPASQGASSTLLANDGSGNLSWTTISGVSGVTGTGTNGQVAFWTGSSTESGSNNLFWDNTNIRLGVGTNTPNAILDLTSTTQGALLPRMTTTQMNLIPTPATGLLIYNTTTTSFNYWNGSAWVAVGTGSGSSGAASTGGAYYAWLTFGGF